MRRSANRQKRRRLSSSSSSESDSDSDGESVRNSSSQSLNAAEKVVTDHKQSVGSDSSSSNSDSSSDSDSSSSSSGDSESSDSSSSSDSDDNHMESDAAESDAEEQHLPMRSKPSIVGRQFIKQQSLSVDGASKQSLSPMSPKPIAVASPHQSVTQPSTSGSDPKLDSGTKEHFGHNSSTSETSGDLSPLLSHTAEERLSQQLSASLPLDKRNSLAMHMEEILPESRPANTDIGATVKSTSSSLTDSVPSVNSDPVNDSQASFASQRATALPDDVSPCSHPVPATISGRTHSAAGIVDKSTPPAELEVPEVHLPVADCGNAHPLAHQMTKEKSLSSLQAAAVNDRSQNLAVANESTLEARPKCVLAADEEVRASDLNLSSQVKGNDSDFVPEEKAHHMTDTSPSCVTTPIPSSCVAPGDMSPMTKPAMSSGHVQLSNQGDQAQPETCDAAAQELETSVDTRVLEDRIPIKGNVADTLPDVPSPARTLDCITAKEPLTPSLSESTDSTELSHGPPTMDGFETSLCSEASLGAASKLDSVQVTPDVDSIECQPPASHSLLETSASSTNSSKNIPDLSPVPGTATPLPLGSSTDPEHRKLSEISHEPVKEEKPQLLDTLAKSVDPDPIKTHSSSTALLGSQSTAKTCDTSMSRADKNSADCNPENQSGSHKHSEKKDLSPAQRSADQHASQEPRSLQQERYESRTTSSESPKKTVSPHDRHRRPRQDRYNSPRRSMSPDCRRSKHSRRSQRSPSPTRWGRTHSSPTRHTPTPYVSPRRSYSRRSRSPRRSGGSGRRRQHRRSRTPLSRSPRRSPSPPSRSRSRTHQSPTRYRDSRRSEEYSSPGRDRSTRQYSPEYERVSSLQLRSCQLSAVCEY